MAEENQVEPQGKATQLPSGAQPVQQITKQQQGEAAQVQQITKEPQRVTAKNPKKVEAGKRLAESNRKRREAKKQVKLEASKPILWNWGCYSSESYRWSWLFHL